MKLPRSLVYCNLAALALNGMVLWLGAVKVFPPVLGITIVLACLGGAVWLSGRINGRL